MPERGTLGVWVVGEAGALLVRPGGRRVDCWCVKAGAADLPSGDRIAHLLLALREDEQGFATVANLAFSGARWRVRRRLAPAMRPALDAAAASRAEPAGVATRACPAHRAVRHPPRRRPPGSPACRPERHANGACGPYPHRRRRRIMLVMTSPTADTLVRRLVLVPDGRDDRADAVRRYRLARLRLEGREVPYEARFSHLKRQYD